MEIKKQFLLLLLWQFIKLSRGFETTSEGIDDDEKQNALTSEPFQKPHGKFGKNLVPLPRSPNTRKVTTLSCSSEMQVLYGASGSISVWDGINTYAPYLDCQWKIIVDPEDVIFIEWTAFDLEFGSPECPYDFVEIYDNVTGKLLGERFCNTKMPPKLLSTSNKVLVKFHTDYSIEKTGFSLQYTSGSGFCEFNGTIYFQNQTLPGCLMVHCINGDWLQNGHIDPACDSCYARWDPHMKTFDDYSYHFQGIGNYSLAQDGTSCTPQYGIFSQFIQCAKWPGPYSCVGPTTYKDSPSTVIEMGVGFYDQYTLYVNGERYYVPDTIPRQVMEGTKVHPVFAWRYQANKPGFDHCVRLLGSSKIAVEKCTYTLNIWVPMDFHYSMYGLCGYYDGYNNTDFTMRNLTQCQLEESPTEFPESWETTGNCVNAQGRKKREIDGVENGACSLDNTTMDDLQARCNEINVMAGDNTPQKELAVMIGDCMYDLCGISMGTSGDQGVLDEWMGNIRVSVEQIVEANYKTTDDVVLPEPLPRAPVVTPTIPSNTVTVYEELTTPSDTGIEIPIIPQTSAPDEEQIMPPESEEEKPHKLSISFNVALDVGIP